MSFGVRFSATGPLFDGRAVRAAQDMADEMCDEIANQAKDFVVDGLKAYVRHPTPYYWTRIEVQPWGSGRRVWDTGIIYGPWLAGVGSRNFPATRFEGYKHWPSATRATQARVQQIMQRVADRYIPRMGG